jgi:hypothetical protein
MHKRTLDSKTRILIPIKRPSLTPIHPKLTGNRFHPNDGANNLADLLHLPDRLLPPKEHPGNPGLHNLTDRNNLHLLLKFQAILNTISNSINCQLHLIPSIYSFIKVTAASTWNFGLQSSSSFVMIQYIGTIFLALYFFCYLLDKVMFGTEN